MKPVRVYVAGPMTGIKNFNYPAFHAEAKRLRALGFHVENPAENPVQTGWVQYMRAAVPQMVGCDWVVLLPGWKSSRGASIERHLALDLGMPVFNAGEITIPCGGRCAA